MSNIEKWYLRLWSEVLGFLDGEDNILLLWAGMKYMIATLVIAYVKASRFERVCKITYLMLED